MSENSGDRAALRTKGAELAVASLFFALGAIVVYDSVRLGAKWGSDGPEPGYFPFYVGLIICAASMVNFLRGLRLGGPRNKVFVLAGQLKLVLAVLAPSVVYVAAIAWLGIYVTSMIFVGFFMRWLGKYAWWKLAAVSFGVNAAFFLIFEIWFKVPLPKGPVEALLGLN